MKKLRLLTILLIAATAAFTACNDAGETDGGGSTSVTFETADTPGDAVDVLIGTKTIKMIYSNNQTGIIFPYSPLAFTPVDNDKSTLTRKFFMSETEVTNALMVEVLQWAYNKGKFSTIVDDHNYLDNTVAWYGDQWLLKFDDRNSKINYSAGNFTVVPGYENHPVILVSWCGAIMFCNWLTEMRDGNTLQVVYTGIDEKWVVDETIEDASKTGYRLPSSEEWEYAARYIGTTEPAVGNLATEYVTKDIRGGHEDLTAGYYWTPADYASGAKEDYLHETETRGVAWYFFDPAAGLNGPMPVAQKFSNQLGLYDMSGNVFEWCFNADDIDRVARGGCYDDKGADFTRVGAWISDDPEGCYSRIGFRFARTQ
ncbi:MAG: SUMF1/EgtB/PvdO family nonheme iron enzyme [Spirochaetes bacterium]|nr:SUMF1/EgtB/PvdO family nonheme iron enzyme [Spirochaetota bacterium]